ncbi:MAG: NTP transferase domain-containing protein [Deltaproteobacteria bacterium]|nr:NTP transferase domain-containing protein [Deltaproteobacteria bacterium]
MQIVILAAGQGKRLSLPSDELPKCLVPIIKDTPYLAYQFEGLKGSPFSKKIIVGGHGFRHLKGYLDRFNPLHAELVFNPDYQKGNLYSLLTAKEGLSEGFYIFNADHYYSPQNYRKIFVIDDGGDQTRAITIYCDRDRTLCDDDMKVRVSTDHRFEVMDKRLKTFAYGYVGVTCVPKGRAGAYWQALKETGEALGDAANVESVINRLAENGERIDIIDISGSWWTEIDTPEDLEKARCTILNHTPQGRIS